MFLSFLAQLFSFFFPFCGLCSSGFSLAGEGKGEGIFSMFLFSLFFVLLVVGSFCVGNTFVSV